MSEEAVKRLHEESALADVAQNANNPYVRAKAVRKITNQNLLAEYAKNDVTAYVRHAAVRKLSDQNQDLLGHIAKYDEDWSVRYLAVEKVFGEALVQEVYSDIVRIIVENHLVVKDLGEVVPNV